MKKTAKSLIILLFFCAITSTVVICCGFFTENSLHLLLNKTSAKTFQNERVYKFEFNGKIFQFSSSDFAEKSTDIRDEFLKNKSINDKISQLQQFGLSDKEIVTYLFPEISPIVQKLENAINYKFVQDKVFVKRNQCEIYIQKGYDGRFLNEKKLYTELLQKVKANKEIKIKIKAEKYNDSEDYKKIFKTKSCFSTNFSSSSEERKNNIKTALAAFDGIILEEGEIFSFNTITGPRNQEAGYSKAKIISNGTFTEGFGGGVCQVSTTIYNACLLAGLEIVEVHQHSLPVSYIEPSFDAMVNTGSSDLVVRNNSGGKIIITTSSLNDTCKVKIFGKKNKYKITRISEKTKVIPKEQEVIETDYLKYGLENLEIGEEKRLSYPKNGYHSNGYLNFYDDKGNLVKQQKIRQNKYAPTKGIVVRREK